MKKTEWISTDEAVANSLAKMTHDKAAINACRNIPTPALVAGVVEKMVKWIRLYGYETGDGFPENCTWYCIECNAAKAKLLANLEVGQILAMLEWRGGVDGINRG